MYGPDKKDHNIETEHLLTMSEQLFGTKPRSPETPFEMPETPSLQAGHNPNRLAGERPSVQRKALSARDFKTKIMKMKSKKML